MCIFNISTPSTGSRHKLQGRSIPDESFVVTEQKKIWDDNYFLFHFRINKTKHRMEGKVILMMRLSQLNAAYFLEGIVGVYDIKIHWKNYVFWPKLIQLLIFMGATSKVSCTKKFAWTFRPYFWKKGNQRNFQFQTRRFLQHLSQFIIRGSWPPPSPPPPPTIHFRNPAPNQLFQSTHIMPNVPSKYILLWAKTSWFTKLRCKLWW